MGKADSCQYGVGYTVFVHRRKCGDPSARALIGTSPHALRLNWSYRQTYGSRCAAAAPAGGVIATTAGHRGAERAGGTDANRQPERSGIPALRVEPPFRQCILPIGQLGQPGVCIRPAVRWSLFDGNRLKSPCTSKSGRSSLRRYEATVLRAVEEVENALVGVFRKSNEPRPAAVGRRAQQSVGMVESLYRNGLTNFQNVLMCSGRRRSSKIGWHQRRADFSRQSPYIRRSAEDGKHSRLKSKQNIKRQLKNKNRGTKCDTQRLLFGWW